MRLILGKAKEALRHKAPEDRLEYRINRSCERLLLNGKFAGSLHAIAINMFFGQLTLPKNYRTVEGFKRADHVYELANQWYEYLPGHSSTFVGCGTDPLRDLGDGSATIYELPLLGKLGINYNGSDAQPVTIYGTDEDTMPVTLTIPDKATFPDNPFTHIDRIHKEQGLVSVHVFQTASDLSVTNLAIMAPKDEETYYRRYILDELASVPLETALVLAKLRHIEFTDDEDVLPFTNLAALESMMDSLQYRAENDVNLADRYEADAVTMLNKELGDTNADIAGPVIRFIYPGGTRPRLQSRY